MRKGIWVLIMLFEDLPINDNCIVELYKDTELVAVYDGRDSIPEEYNTAEVIDIFVDKNKLCIEIGE